MLSGCAQLFWSHSQLIWSRAALYSQRLWSRNRRCHRVLQFMSTMLPVSSTTGSVIGVENGYRRALWNQPSTNSLPSGLLKSSRCDGPHAAPIFYCRSEFKHSMAVYTPRSSIGIQTLDTYARRNWLPEHPQLSVTLPSFGMWRSNGETGP